MPIMSLGDELKNLSLNGKTKKQVDAVSQAIEQGRPPTVRDVKKSVKVVPSSPYFL